MASRQQSFVNEMYSAARRAGLPDAQARVAATQAALETGYGRSVKGNNYFGIKAGASWTGKTQNFQTWESVAGRRQNIRDDFRAYDTPEESLRDWAGLMQRNYPDVMRATTFQGAVQGLFNGKYGSYATDPDYASKLGYINNNFAPTAAAAQQTNWGTPSTPGQSLTNIAGQAPDTLYSVTPTPAPRAPVTAVQRAPISAPTPRSLLTSQPTPDQMALLGAKSIQPGYPALPDNVPVPTPRPSPIAPPTMQPVAPMAPMVPMSAPSPQMSAPAAPSYSMPRGAQAAYDAYAGGPVAQATDGSLVGTIGSKSYRYSPQFDYTTVTKGNTQSVIGGIAGPLANAIGQPQQGIQPEQQQTTPAGGLFSQPTTRLGGAVRGTAGSVLGGMAGGLLGPIGGLLGAFIGRELAQGVNPLNTLTSPFTQQQQTYGIQDFPSAPKNTSGQDKGYGRGDLSSYGESVADRSGQFSGAVDSGRGGLW